MRAFAIALLVVLGLAAIVAIALLGWKGVMWVCTVVGIVSGIVGLVWAAVIEISER